MYVYDVCVWLTLALSLVFLVCPCVLFFESFPLGFSFLVVAIFRDFLGFSVSLVLAFILASAL